MKPRIVSNLIACFLLSATVVLFTGCATSDPNQVNRDAVAKIEKGVTTKTEVLEILGEPTSLTVEPTGDGQKEIIEYHHSRFADKRRGILPTFNLFGGGYDIGAQGLTVTINDEGIVEDVQFHSTNSDTTTP